jgi:flagellar P-ring protein precursor FlgI
MVALLMQKLILLFSFVFSCSVFASKVIDVTSIDGIRNNQLIGYGLVVGLDGTGDKAQFTQRSLQTYLDKNGIKLPANVKVKSKNVAAVLVSASLPSFASVGQLLDVTVSSIGDAKSLRGGTLILTPLKGVDDKVYALAQGNMVVGGLDESGADGSKISINISSAGRIPSGGTVEVPFKGRISKDGMVYLSLKNPSFKLAQNINQSINKEFGYDVSETVNHTKIRLFAPKNDSKLVDFLARINYIDVDIPKSRARVVVNSRTGTVVMTESVMVLPVAITHGGITLKVDESQDVKLLNNNVEQNSDVAIVEEKQRIFNMSKGADLNDIVDSFNEMGLAPSDLVAILEALKSVGSLQADLDII